VEFLSCPGPRVQLGQRLSLDTEKETISPRAIHPLVPVIWSLEGVPMCRLAMHQAIRNRDLIARILVHALLVMNSQLHEPFPSIRELATGFPLAARGLL
jgi:hypothetical protein